MHTRWKKNIKKTIAIRLTEIKLKFKSMNRIDYRHLPRAM